MELFHALNRGVDKRMIFLDNQDRLRFAHGLEIFNDTKPAENTAYFYNKNTRSIEHIDLRGRYKALKDGPDKECLVDIHGWCIMGNHYHLLVSERVEGGLTKFLMKLNVGYAKYFNERYGRVGTLFQGRTKKVHIATDAHFLHILHYIHLNPLDFLKGAESWRTLEIKKAKHAFAHLEKYRWSSYLDYCGKDNFPGIISKDLFADVFENYKETIKDYLQDIEMEPIRDMILE